MSDFFRFPNGYEVKVLRKADVLKSIDDNIIDKEVALAIVKQCEIDAINFLKAGRWAGIPFMGSIRIPKSVQKFNSPETQAVLAEAKETLEREKYVLFRTSVAKDIARQTNVERYYMYVVSKFVGRNTKYFRIKSAKYGDKYARVLAYTLSDINISDISSYE